MNKLSFAWPAFAMSFLLSGCHVLHCNRDVPLVPETPIEPSVVVGGLVDNSGEMPLTGNINSLGTLLSVAGLQRDSAVVPVTTSSPLSGRQILTSALARLTVVEDESLIVQKKFPTGNIPAPDENDPIAKSFHDAVGLFRKSEKEILSWLDANVPDMTFREKQKTTLDTSMNEFANAKLRLSKVSTSDEYVKFRDSVRELKNLVKKFQGLQRTSLSRTTPRAAFSRQDVVVHLIRQSRHFFLPYEFARTGLASEIVLQHGDLVLVEAIDNTVLKTPFQIGDGNITLQVSNQRSRTLKRGEKQSLASVEEDALGKSGNNLACFVLERRYSNQIQNCTILIPREDMASTVYGPLPTASQDRIRVVPFFQAPLISESIIGTAARAVTATEISRLERRLPVLNKHEKKMKGLKDMTHAVAGAFSNLPLIP